MEDIFLSADLTSQRCEALVNGIMESMQNGLSKYGEELKMLPSYVTKFHAAHGTFYALDMVIRVSTPSPSAIS
jgi:hexokinase